MFETSTIQAGALAPRGKASLLTISLIAHSAVIIGAVAISIATVRFPTAAPDEYREAPTFTPVRIPPPLGDPNGGKKPAVTPVQKPQQKLAAVPAQPTAPSVVPDTTQPAAASGPATDATGPSTGIVEGPIGVPWGTKDSIGDLDAPPAPVDTTPVDETIHAQHEANLEAPVLVARVEPIYPPSMARIGVPATVIVRCVIDKNGAVRDVQVVRGAMPPFNQSVIDAVQQWRYRPASLKGTAVNSYLEVHVTFNVHR